MKALECVRACACARVCVCVCVCVCIYIYIYIYIYIKALINNQTYFKATLKRFLYHHSFYSINEYYEYEEDRRI